MDIQKIYLDMDGVLADFDKGVWDLCHMEAQPMNGKRDAALDDLMWEGIRKQGLSPVPAASRRCCLGFAA